MSAKSNARWISLAQVAKILLQFASIAILARLLPPTAYGEIAMLTVVTNFVGLFRDLGTAASLIQEPNLDTRRISTVFWLNVALGVSLSVATLVMAAPLAGLFNAPQVVSLLALASPSFILTSLGSAPKALLERESKFAQVVAVEVLTAVLQLVVTVACAASSMGAQSWIIGTLVGTTAASVAFQIISRMSWRFQFDWGELKSVTRFSGGLFAFNVVNYFSRNADSVVVGRLLGAAQLGYYNAAYKMMLFPLQNMTFVANRALFPVMSRGLAEGVSPGSTYLKATTAIAYLSAPLMFGVGVLAEPFVGLMMGPSWGPTVDVLQWLAPIGLIQSIVSTTGAVLMAAGRTGTLFRLGVYGSALMVTAFIAGSHWGIVGVAIAYLIANVFNMVPPMAIVARILDLQLGQLARSLLPPVLCAGLMAAAIALVDHFATSSFLPIVRLVVLGILGTIFYLAATMLLARNALQITLSLVPDRMQVWKRLITTRLAD